MKIWSAKNTHENSIWVKIWLSMNSTLRKFSKTNFSPHDFKTSILVLVHSFLDLTLKIAHRLKFHRKWMNSMKKWKPMFRKFLEGHGPQSSHQGRRRVTLIFGGMKLKISKWFFHHRFSWSRNFWIYLQFWNWMSRN